MTVDQREMLERYRPWLRVVAAGLLAERFRSRLVDDLAQEGWIAVWRALQSHDPARAPADFWLKKKAHDRMRTVLRDWFADLRDIRRDTPVDDLTPWDTVGICHDLDLAYHCGDIARALDQLTRREREYVVLRFWKGFRKPDMIAWFGYEPTGLWKTARIKLRESLAHLVDTA